MIKRQILIGAMRLDLAPSASLRSGSDRNRGQSSQTNHSHDLIFVEDLELSIAEALALGLPRAQR
jgi:hypothetical protein